MLVSRGPLRFMRFGALRLGSIGSPLGSPLLKPMQTYTFASRSPTSWFSSAIQKEGHYHHDKGRHRKGQHQGQHHNHHQRDRETHHHGNNRQGQALRPVLLSASAIAFQKFEDGADGETREQAMIKAAHKKKPSNIVVRTFRAIREGILTFLRFVQLLCVFIPVFLCAPAVFFGSRDKSGERSGALWWFTFLRVAMELAGPTFIKLGQWAASRTDIFPSAMCTQMGKLHSNANMHPLEYTKQVISDAFERPFEDCFSEFDETPLGVGAMAQVYRAKLPVGLAQGSAEVDARGNPYWMAVKVLHPGIDATIRRDLSIMRFFANAIDALPTMEWLSLPGEVQTFGRMMQSQLDLRIEAENLRIFTNNFSDAPNINFPQPVMRFSTEKMLVEQYVQGVSMEHILKFCKQAPLDRRIAGLGLDAFLKMLLIDNFIHSDLHPGNILVQFHQSPEGTVEAQEEMVTLSKRLARIDNQAEWTKEWAKLETYKVQIVFIDAGLVTELDPVGRRNFADLFKAIATFNGYRAGELMVERSRTPETAIDAEVFALRTQKLVDQVKSRTFALGSVSIGDLLTSMLDMVRRHHVRMESDFITVVLSILLLEGIGRQLNPDLDLFSTALPILRKISPKGAMQKSDLTTDDILQMVKVWALLESRRFITAGIQDIHRCVKYDRLSPNQ